MTRITVEDNGRTIEIEVSEEVAEVMADERRIHVRERQNKANRQEISLSKALEDGFDYADESANFEDRVAMRDEIKRALNYLSIEQRELVRLVYFEGIPQSEIAQKCGVSHQAIARQLKTIRKKLKDFLI